MTLTVDTPWAIVALRSIDRSMTRDEWRAGHRAMRLGIGCGCPACASITGVSLTLRERAAVRAAAILDEANGL